uniref:RDH7 dehydrogenase n=1 Tax=Malurus cyaneus samueli TaxID=2593467 RepID=A0A8C5UA13_9PASS
MWLYAVAALLGLFLLRRWHRERQTVPGLSEKHVLITGCDSGFGNLLARQLDARGLRVLAACLTETGAAQLRAAASSRLQTVLLDVTSSKSIADVAAWVVGTPIITPIAKVLDVNLLGLVEVTLSLLPLLRRARGRVVNVASVMGRLSFFGGGYCLSKFGVEAFSDSLRLEMRNFGVKVSVIDDAGFLPTQSTSLGPRGSHGGPTAPSSRGATQLCSVPWSQCFFSASTVGSSLQLLQKSYNSDLSLVTNCMEHALTSVHPRVRYSAGWDAKLLYIPLSYLPSAFSDALFSLFYPKTVGKA